MNKGMQVMAFGFSVLTQFKFNETKTLSFWGEKQQKQVCTANLHSEKQG